MRRREIQSFSLKLSDLKEYDVVRQERLERKIEEKLGNASATPDSPMKVPSSMPRWGPKSKQEIRERIGLKSWMTCFPTTYLER